MLKLLKGCFIITRIQKLLCSSGRYFVFVLVSVTLAVLSFGFNLSTERNDLGDYSRLFDICFGYTNHLEGLKTDYPGFSASDDDTTGVRPSDNADSLNNALTTDSLSAKRISDSTHTLQIPVFNKIDSTAKIEDTVKTPAIYADSTVNKIKLVQPDSTSADRMKNLPGFKMDSSGNKKIDFMPLSKFDSLRYKTLEDSLRKKGIPDSLIKRMMDTTKLSADTVVVDPRTLDSTARKEYFHYQRNEDFYVKMYQKKNSRFFAQPKTFPKERKIELDSTGEYVQIREKTAGQETKVMLRLKFDDYIAMRLNARRRELWDELGYKYEIKKAEKDLGGLIKDFTDFEIPLPSVGVLSIFGTPKISLKIGGSVLIHGAWRNETTEGITASRLGNSRNEPDFKQQVQINVNGTIGDKLQISADWNTERTFEYENMLKIKYTGYPDEIVQSIEAGNVSLQTSSLVGGGEALFGVKAGFKMGPLTLTAIASQKKGEIKEVSLSGGSSEQVFVKKVYEYSTNHFFIDTIYADPKVGIFNKYITTRQMDGRYYVSEIEVWKSNKTKTDFNNERNGIAVLELPNKESYSDGEYPQSIKAIRDNPVVGESEAARFTRLQENSDYTIQKETGMLTLKNVSDEDVIAVAYKSPQGTYGDLVSSFSAADSNRVIVLKLVKPQYLQPTYKKAWNLMLKNIYPIGASSIQKEGFKLDIKYVNEKSDSSSTSETGVRFLNAFGLDLVSASGAANPDGEFDFDPDRTILTATGEIIFPTLQPFGKDYPISMLSPDYIFQQVYDTTQVAARNNREKDKFIITGKYTGAASSTFNIGFNIVENSVKVSLNGNQLVAGVDFIVDYNVGQLTLRNPDAMVANANLKITFEQNDLFQLASKTLVGVRGVFDFSSKTKLGFSALNLAQQTLSDKVRIGEEPLSNSIYGVDFTTSADLPFMTKFLDNFISTKEKSSISFNGEFAYMRPDPNTKKSTISSDDGLSIAYIDDFEGSKKILPVGISYTSWKDLSYPVGLDSITHRNAKAAMNYKGRTFWYNMLPASVRVNEIWPKKKVAQGDDFVTVLDLEYRPSRAGMYNYMKNPLQHPDSSWGGLMKKLSTSNSNLVDENIEYIELWYRPTIIKGDEKMYINLGLISEDVIPNGQRDFEDKNLNDVLDIERGEDTGIDGINDNAERVYADSMKIAYDNDDPAHDNWRLVSGSDEPNDYENCNGTEGNGQSLEVGKFPDTEDLNRNLSLDAANAYFEYEVPLSPDTLKNPYIVPSEGEGKKWYLLRIPLKDYKRKVGEASLSNVQNIRLYFRDISEKIHLELTEFNLVGNQWQKAIKDDPLMKVTVVNVEDNSNYTSPPGVFREKDRSRPDQNIEKNEQSLNLQLLGLPRNQKREVFKTLARPLDLFSYKQMKLFVHGDETISSNVNISNFIDENHYSAEVYYRFGADSNNYYEYRQPVQSGWNEISINFKDLTAYKQGRDTSLTNGNRTAQFPVNGKPGHFYVIKGSPSLTKISVMSIGVYHPGDKSIVDSVKGEVWVNELRVIGADDTPGWAYTASSSIKLADLMNINLNINQTDPNFHRLSERFGSRVDQKSWGVQADLDVIKLLPFDMNGSNLKISFSHNESISKPKYLPGTDVAVDAAVSKIKAMLIAQGRTEAEANHAADSVIIETQSLQVSDSWNFANIKLKLPTDFWLIRESFNALTFGFNYNKTFSRNPTTLDNSTWVWNATMNYNLSFSPENFFYPADIPVFGTILSLFSDYRNVKFYFTPQSFVADVTAKRQRSYNTQRQLSSVKVPTMISRDFSSTRGASVNWKLTDGGILNLSSTYTVNINSSLAFLETDQYNVQRSESQIWRDIFSGVFFGRDFSYSQNFEIRTNPRLPSLWDINKNFTISTGYSVKYDWGFDFRQESIGRGAQYDSRFNLQMTLKLKDLFEPLFAEEKKAEDERPTGFQNIQASSRNRNRERDAENLPVPEGQNQQQPNLHLPKPPVITVDSLYKTIPDTLFSYLPDTLKFKALDSLKLVLADSVKRMNDKNLLTRGRPLIDSVDMVPKTPVYKTAFMMLKTFTKIVFFDYESISINFSNDNNLKAGGLFAKGNGSKNFFGIKYSDNNGPSRLFMLGLSNDAGRRAANASITDNYSQRNNLEFKTSKPLWEGARIDLNWKVGWSIQTSNNFTTDSLGNAMSTPTSLQKSASGSLDRSFLSLPPTLIFSFFKSGIKKVNELYQASSGKTTNDLSNAFVDGFETFPIFAKFPFLKDFAKFIPRPNWRIQWDGLEKLPLLKSIAKKVTLEHAYTSNYSEGWKLNTTDGTSKDIQSQRISYGFGPLVGLNLTFNSLWDGNFTGSIKYNTKNDYSLGAAAKNITESFSRDIGISANYSKSGFEIPFFGLALKNDIEFSFAYTYGKTSNINYKMEEFTEEGTPLEINTRTSIEPRVKYVMSSKVTLSIFYKRTSQQPEGSSSLPATTTNEMGLDVNISIQ